MAKAEWSSYVEKLWRAIYSIMHERLFVHCDGDMWYLSDVRLLDVTEARHHVELCPTGAFHTCNCYDFLSSMIPCVGVCQVFSRIEKRLFAVNNLAPRWRLSYHPLYLEALKHLNVTEPMPLTMRFNVYKKVHVPTSCAIRITKFPNACSTIEQQVANNSHLYRLFMTNLAPFEDGVGDETVRGSLEPFRLPQDAALIPLTFSDCPVATALVRAPHTRFVATLSLNVMC
ncbi:hypothetical protein AaE_015777 [Aphanomyces astaci]|uniref:Uncharacterized protein n=1 Tax=Aphanomyces astaci TaxID=112090 RepID=A0A6A4Z0S1_APHAT|nr:hypothetical protein AaE_015777 [Aphanomyces astaci]